MAGGLPASLAQLLQPEAYPHAVSAITLVETHLSWVLLTGEFSYKIKRPVRYPFVDLRSVERRSFLCREEVRLNSRFAPELYCGVSAITVEGSRLRVDGAGRLLEHAVRMRQFGSDDELDRLLAAHRIEPSELALFGSDLAAVHATLPVAAPGDGFGEAAGIHALILGNLEECAASGRMIGNSADPLTLRAMLERRLQAANGWLTQRLATGRVRECHGDLHCGNVVRLRGHLEAFDCVEFEPRFRWIDVADEIAFLAADLDARGCTAHSHAFLGGYLECGGDYEACRHLDLYKAHRALVRAKVAALRAAEAGQGEERADGSGLYETYVDCARRCLEPRRPRLILMCGLSGSGKTWMARQLAPALSAVHLRSDVERKRFSAGQSGDTYGAEARRQTYQHLAHCASDMVAGGYSVIVDATFQSRADRAPFRKIAGELGIPAWLVHCHAPIGVMEARIRERLHRQDDPSEADVQVLQQQRNAFEPPAGAEGLQIIEADATSDAVLAQVVDALGAGRTAAYP
jgi:aminoglycoside phosphotransferase family enzyme/predicted kinase